MRLLLASVAALVLSACATAPATVNPASDAPEFVRPRGNIGTQPASYAEATREWHGATEINAWIGARFEYDFNRAMRLSESQRELGPRIQIYEPSAFFDRPLGVCVDLARFAVESLRTAAPSTKPAYLMIEFDPTVIAGNTLRRHWVVQYEVEGKLYFFADSKRPGHVAGPYADISEYISQYSQYRQRKIVSYKILESYERKLKKQAPKASREERA